MLTSLSEGNGLYVSVCQIINIYGFCLLFDCPLNLSRLSIFSPVGVDEEEFKVSWCNDFRNSECSDKKRQKVDKSLDASDLIYSEPYYKTVNDLHLWNAMFIDIVMISSYIIWGCLVCRFLLRKKDFLPR